jgi:signal transduction histidine kinase
VTVVDATVDLDGIGATSSVVVRVHDDGLGSAAPLHDTYGLVGMRERAEALGGSLYAGPAPSGGWLVHAVFPVEAAGGAR